MSNLRESVKTERGVFSNYYSEYSVSISPQFEADRRLMASDTGGGLGAHPSSAMTPPQHLPNLIINHDNNDEGGRQSGVSASSSDSGSGSGSEPPSNQREDKYFQFSQPNNANINISVDAESSAAYQSKASRSIVSVAFATTTKERSQTPGEHDGYVAQCLSTFLKSST